MSSCNLNFRRPVLFALLLTISGGLLLPSACYGLDASLPARPYRVVMVSGQQAPDAPLGVVFDEVNASHQNSPRINNRGEVVFPARLKGSGIDFGNDWTFYRDNGKTLDLLAREGDPALGQVRGSFFDSISPSQLNISDEGDVTFGMSLTGMGVDNANDLVLYLAQQGVVSPVARIGDRVTVANQGSGFLTRSFYDVRFDDANRLYYGVGIGDSQREEFGPAQAIFQYEGGNSTLLLDVHSSTPQPVEAYFNTAIAGDSRFSALVGLDLPIGNARRDTEILEWTGRRLISVVREEDHPPGFPQFAEFGQPSIGTPFADLTRNNVGVTAFTSWLFGVNPAGGGLRQSIWTSNLSGGQPLRLVLSEQTPLANRPDYLVTDIFTDSGSENLQLNSAGDLAFFAEVRDQTDTRDDEWALMVERDGQLDWIYKQGDPAPGLPAGTTFQVRSFFRHTGFQMNDQGQIVFTAGLQSPTGEFSRGVFLAETDGQVIPLLITGDLIEIAPGDRREVDYIEHFSDIAPAGGLANSFNDRGELALLVRFVDDSTSVIVLNTAVPEPTSLALLGGGVLWGLARRRSLLFCAA